jgi:hypothetical protein
MADLSRPTQFRSLLIWKRAAGFHLSHFTSLFPVLPFLCFPVVGDALSSLLIRQQVCGGSISPWEALRNVWSLVPRLFAMKLYFEAVGFLWALVPIYGILPSIKHRLYWAMASNVLVFEDLSGEAGRNRCRELIENFSRGLAVRTLLTIPALLLTGFIIVWMVTGNVFASLYSYGFWTLIFLFLWVVFPASGAVNTFLYLEMLKPQE